VNLSSNNEHHRSPDARLIVLLDQNVPREIAPWLGRLREDWDVSHTSAHNLQAASDESIRDGVVERSALLITFDEDFTLPPVLVERGFGVVRLRVHPTTVENVQEALARLATHELQQPLRGYVTVVRATTIRQRSVVEVLAETL
jgi:predicted nuclease of predicted toxin-antitoxin system